MQWTQHLEVELFGCSTKSLKDVQCRVASIHVLRTEVMLNKFMCLLLNPTFNFFSVRRKEEILKSQCTQKGFHFMTSDQRQTAATFIMLFGLRLQTNRFRLHINQIMFHFENELGCIQRNAQMLKIHLRSLHKKSTKSSNFQDCTRLTVS